MVFIKLLVLWGCKMNTFSTQIEHDRYSKTLAVSKREVIHKETKVFVFDVWSMLNNTTWQIVANAMSPRLIKEFFNIEVQ